MRLQHSASWHILEISAKIYIRVSSSVIPLIITFYKKSKNFSLLNKMSVQSFPILEFDKMSITSSNISEFFDLVMTNLINLSLMYIFILSWISFLEDFYLSWLILPAVDFKTVLQNFNIVGSSDLIALSKTLKKSSGTICSTFLSLQTKLIAKASNYIALMLLLGNMMSFMT